MGAGELGDALLGDEFKLTMVLAMAFENEPWAPTTWIDWSVQAGGSRLDLHVYDSDWSVSPKTTKIVWLPTELDGTKLEGHFEYQGTLTTNDATEDSLTRACRVPWYHRWKHQRRDTRL